MAGKTILSENQRKLLKIIGNNKNICQYFYLTGGTALAEFYLHHRLSEDLDFFSEEEIDSQIVFAFLKSIQKSAGIKKIDAQQSFNRNLFFLHLPDGDVIKTEFTYFPFPRIEKKNKIDNLLVDSVLDIAVNKIFTNLPEHQLNPEIITTTPESEPNSVPPEIVQLLNLLDLQEKLVYWKYTNIHDLALVLETDEDSPRLKKDEAKAIAERTEELTTAIEATLATLTTAIAVSIQSEEMQKTWQTLIPGEHFATPDEAQHFAQELLGSFYIQYTRRLRQLSSSVNHDDKTVDPINAEEQAIDVAWELTGVAQPIESTGDPATLAEKRAT